MKFFHKAGWDGVGGGGGDLCVHGQSLSMNHDACNKSRWQNAWESDSWRPRHPQALDDEELLIIEGSPGAQHQDGRSAKNGLKKA